MSFNTCRTSCLVALSDRCEGWLDMLHSDWFERAHVRRRQVILPTPIMCVPSTASVPVRSDSADLFQKLHGFVILPKYHYFDGNGKARSRHGWGIACCTVMCQGWRKNGRIARQTLWPISDAILPDCAEAANKDTSANQRAFSHTAKLRPEACARFRATNRVIRESPSFLVVANCTSICVR